MRNLTIYFGHASLKTVEGGNSRNSAIIEQVGKTNCQMFIFYTINKFSRVTSGIKVLFKFFSFVNENVFLFVRVAGEGEDIFLCYGAEGILFAAA